MTTILLILFYLLHNLESSDKNRFYINRAYNVLNVQSYSPFSTLNNVTAKNKINIFIT